MVTSNKQQSPICGIVALLIARLFAHKKDQRSYFSGLSCCNIESLRPLMTIQECNDLNPLLQISDTERSHNTQELSEDEAIKQQWTQMKNKRNIRSSAAITALVDMIGL
jgi:FtsZ-interacting cell division protein ZipA